MSSLLDRGMRILSVNSGSVSLASFCFRLSLDERFHKIPAHTHDREDQHHGHMRLILYTHLSSILLSFLTYRCSI